MIVIRNEQMDALGQIGLKVFEDRVVVRLNKLFPEECEALGETIVREIIRYGIRQAKRYDIVIESDVCLYIDLMFVFGVNFDKDRQLTWVPEILNDAKLESASIKMNRLYDAGLEHQNAGTGIGLDTAQKLFVTERV